MCSSDPLAELFRLLHELRLLISKHLRHGTVERRPSLDRHRKLFELFVSSLVNKGRLEPVEAMADLS